VTSFLPFSMDLSDFGEDSRLRVAASQLRPAASEAEKWLTSKAYTELIIHQIDRIVKFRLKVF
jgi:nitrogen-specific signal transduction histidine kinase